MNYKGGRGEWYGGSKAGKRAVGNFKLGDTEASRTRWYLMGHEGREAMCAWGEVPQLGTGPGPRVGGTTRG